MSKAKVFILATAVCGAVAIGIPKAAKTSKATKTIALDGTAWALQVDLPGFKVERDRTWSGPSQSTLFAMSRKTNVVVSVYLEKQPTLNSAEQCRDYYQEKAKDSPLKQSDVSHKPTEDMAQVHYMVTEFQGMRIRQKNINAYMYRDGVCVDIHLSALDFDEADEQMFSRILESAKYTER